MLFDHLVHFVHRPEEAVALLGERGLSARLGGDHERWGTYNALCYFDLSYLEFLGLRSPELAARVEDNDLVRQAVRELPSGEAFARVAIRTTRMEEDAERFRKLGLLVTGPFPGSRRREDGSLLSWSMLFLEWPDGHGPPLPFVIQWGESDEARLGGLKEQGIIRPHDAGRLRLEQVVFAVRDADATAEEWARLFGLKTAAPPSSDESLRARCREVDLPGGRLLFCSPTGPGQVEDVIAARGEGPFLLRLSGGKERTKFELLGGLYEFL